MSLAHALHMFEEEDLQPTDEGGEVEPGGTSGFAEALAPIAHDATRPEVSFIDQLIEGAAAPGPLPRDQTVGALFTPSTQTAPPVLLASSPVSRAAPVGEGAPGPLGGVIAGSPGLQPPPLVGLPIPHPLEGIGLPSWGVQHTFETKATSRK